MVIIDMTEFHFPPTVYTDESVKEQAFAEYRQEHGISDSRRLGDMPLQVVSEVLQRAARLAKERA